MGGRAIPFILSIDVEPDGFQAPAATSTTGYDAATELFAWLRPRLERTTGRPPSFGWFFRMDPQVEATFGRADALVARFESRVDDLVRAGDHLGLHTHPIRWSEEHDAWVHDVDDGAFVRESIESSFAAYERALGTACERHRMGAALFTESVVDALERVHARVDSAFEPVRGVGVDGRPVSSGTDTSPLVGRNVDCSSSPRGPFRPDVHEFRRPGSRPSELVLLPLSSSRLSSVRPGWQTAAAGVARRRVPPARPLYLGGRVEPVPFWDLVARQARIMRRPYINLALRTGAADAAYFGRVRTALEALVQHPLARRIEVVDPLVALSRLLPEPVRTTAA